MSTLSSPNEPFLHADLDGRPPAEPIIPGRGIERNLVTGPAAKATAALRKAWLCDDADDLEQACRLRGEAAWFLRMAIRDGSWMSGHGSADLALLADLLRRSGDCRGAIAAAKRGLEAGPPEGVGSLLLFQLRLAGAGDEGRHDIG